MKKNYFYLFLAMPIIALVLTSSSGGYSGTASGSPGDGGTCTNCHNNTGSFGASVAVTTNIPAGGYALSTTYNITVTLTSSPNSTKSGFQIAAEKSGGAKVGSFAAGTGSQVVNSNTGVTHTSTGNAQKTWTFTWTSPAVNEGTVTFYASAVAGNNAGGNSGDQVVTTSTPVNALSNESFGLATFKLFPNPTTDNITVELPQGYTQVYASIVDVMGKTILYQEISDINNNINVASLSPGTYILSLSNEEGSTTKTFVKK